VWRERFEVVLALTTIGLAAGNESRTVFSIRPDQNDDTIVRPSETDESLLAVTHVIVFVSKQRPIECFDAPGKIDAMLSKVLAAFGRIVARHNYRICNK
jgi:hypothetical protein